ncbi:aminopeptidase N [Parvibium lacunae]|uniref:Aminopeptidase N n=1 Tax=Parvibium lacunae TaxID=1888893 RepID=A0A368L514_9BURK|nr:aminopeptidase N [Parvibium lacunae]
MAAQAAVPAQADRSPTYWRQAYQVSDYLIESVSLRFELDPVCTRVSATLTVYRHPAAAQTGALPPLVLQGEALTLERVAINNVELAATDYTLTETSLTLPVPAAHFTVQTTVTLAPAQNTSLMGLYVSNHNFFTQCEAEGFRRITWFLDRPDIMARYQVRLEANQADYPVLLANGNLVATALLPNGRHAAEWQDPFPKPSYLFALVAGQLSCVESTIRTQSGAEKQLQIWVEARDLDKTEHAMQSLIRAIHWDEQRFGRELDLDRFMIVAVSDFNMGAMENKGLNIFNTKYVLANPAIATDVDFANIESVVGHEYFHNWSGNRVTCRDWFQLSLKEGLTVFRDQEFSMDMASDFGAQPLARAVRRIEDVRALRSTQFVEDAGPMAHPIRPDSYQEISNFYTATVYEKGAEVIRMLQTLLGPVGFRRGMDTYFARHDGQAVTCDDFVQALADANPESQVDFTQFKHWYSQAGTPRVTVEQHFDAATGTIRLDLTQRCPPVGIERQQMAGSTDKQPYLIPLKVAFFSTEGQPLETACFQAAAAEVIQHEHLLQFTQAKQSFEFKGVPAKHLAVIPSLGRDFSAPISLQYPYSQQALITLLAHDTDPFNRWEAGQQLFQQEILRLYTWAQEQDEAALSRHAAGVEVNAALLAVVAQLAQDQTLAPAFREISLTLPSFNVLTETLVVIDPARLHWARETLRAAIAGAVAAHWETLIQQTSPHLPPVVAYAPNAEQAGYRAWRNLCLQYWVLAESELVSSPARVLAEQQYWAATNMTDRLAALSVLTQESTASEILTDFAAQWQHEPLVMDKWFSLQAMAAPSATRSPVAILQAVEHLLQHSAYSPRNPNKIYALLLRYFANNPAGFHWQSVTGETPSYDFWVAQVSAIDAFNPQVAARLARTLEQWQRYVAPLAHAMQRALQQLQQQPALSKDVREVVEKALQ